MVVINDYLPLNHIQLQKNSRKEIDIFMDSEFDRFIEENIIEKIKKKIK